VDHRTQLGRSNDIHHFFEVVLPDTISIADTAHMVTVEMDLSEWFTNPNDYSFPDDPEITRSVPTQDSLSLNGRTVFQVESVEERE
jgi:hypothetical protein